MGRMINEEKIFVAGKYKGECISEVPDGYLEWLIDQYWLENWERPIYKRVLKYRKTKKGVIEVMNTIKKFSLGQKVKTKKLIGDASSSGAKAWPGVTGIIYAAYARHETLSPHDYGLIIIDHNGREKKIHVFESDLVEVNTIKALAYRNTKTKELSFYTKERKVKGLVRDPKFDMEKEVEV